MSVIDHYNLNFEYVHTMPLSALLLENNKICGGKIKQFSPTFLCCFEGFFWPPLGFLYVYKVAEADPIDQILDWSVIQTSASLELVGRVGVFFNSLHWKGSET